MKKTASPLIRFLQLLCMPEPQFLLPGAVSVTVGTAVGYAAAGEFNFVPAMLALIAIVFINAGSNMLNDYFDHLSGNDWFNENFTPFGGGSGYIQEGIVTPAAMLVAGIGALMIGGSVGVLLVFITKSVFILSLGVIGVLAGIFWTTPPVKFCYRLPGEPYIFTVFGLLPVHGAYYLQTGRIDFLPLLPSFIVGFLIANVALINSIPDRDADAAVNKKTFVVRFGIPAAVKFYRFELFASYAAALLMIIFKTHFYAGLFFLCTLPFGIVLSRMTRADKISVAGVVKPNALTIVMYVLCGLTLSVGFLIV
jgi:1,4-dihydroxy-2-naphthoate octaprenyltransferase